MRGLDYDLLDRLYRSGNVLSASEVDDKETCRIRREYHPGSSIIAWTLSPEWTDPKPYAGEHSTRGSVKGESSYGCDSGATAGEILIHEDNCNDGRVYCEACTMSPLSKKIPL
jgi:hypothetical protein